MPSRWSERGRWLLPEAPGPDEGWVHVLPVRWAWAGPATWHLHHYIGLKKLMLELRPEVIHLWEEPWSLVTYQALFIRNRHFPQVPIVLEVDQNILKRLPPPFEQVRRAVLNQTSVVLGRSDEAIRVAKACGYSGPSGRIGYGVDQSLFRPTNRETARSKFGLTGFTVGYVGRLIEEKGVDDLIAAIAASTTQWNLAIMGEGPSLSTLQQQASRLGLGDRMRFLPWGSPADVAEFMGCLDVLALLTRTTPTVREQFGRVIIEAQACGTPVIGSTCGAIPDVVGAGGWIVPERAPEAVAALLDRLAHSPAELCEVRARAERGVVERFSFSIAAEALASAWRTAVSGHRCMLDTEPVANSD